ncbi:hypothetical protein [Asticcacaulis sp. AND118]|uniref:hypothetical protein n=1 Tax=Asticcacaulis sp. AND118 TaxID=2840468 RepID=UPI001CFFF3EB|nr:hypothetical protein [Asticcacaulis sp. AND118]UDF05347.1 hypothetical protein LH365_14145 [Asticcacaulis sp. AND118]
MTINLADHLHLVDCIEGTAEEKVAYLEILSLIACFAVYTEQGYSMNGLDLGSSVKIRDGVDADLLDSKDTDFTGKFNTTGRDGTEKGQHENE